MIKNDADCYEIYDRETGELLGRGDVRGRKTNNPAHIDLSYISVDGKWYFNTKDDSAFLVKQVDRGLPDVPFDGPGKYVWKYWRDYLSELVDLYRDFSIDEVDEEVRDLVTELNKWDGIQTLGSCCGHDQYELWIQIDVVNTHNFNIILNVLRSPKIFPKMLDRFRIALDSDKPQCINCDKIIHDNPMNLSIVLMTTDIGKRAYESARMLARYLSVIRESITGV